MVPWRASDLSEIVIYKHDKVRKVFQYITLYSLLIVKSVINKSTILIL